MHYYRITNDGEASLIAVDDDTAHALTAVEPQIGGFADLAAAAAGAKTDVDALAADLAADAPVVDFDPTDAALPIVPEEVWAAGVTYQISEEAREDESGMPEMYLDVYEAERPEIFFKATASRTVGPGDAIGIRGDSEWDVPEPELGIVLYDGEVVGYTIGNDVSSRSIEGDNPLYLPQAKMYDRCCSLGPCVASVDSVGDPHDLGISMSIVRDGETMYDDATSTAEMARSCEELVDCWTAHDTVPETGVLLTGTSLVPEEGFTLQPDDEVHIEIEGIGDQTNPVVEV